MKRFLLIGVVISMLAATVLAEERTTTTQPASSSQPAVTSQPAEDAMRYPVPQLGYEYGAAWERIDELLDKPKRDWSEILEKQAEATELLLLQVKSVSIIRSKLRNRLKQDVETGQISLTPDGEAAFDKWMEEGRKKSK